MAAFSFFFLSVLLIPLLLCCICGSVEAQPSCTLTTAPLCTWTWTNSHSQWNMIPFACAPKQNITWGYSLYTSICKLRTVIIIVLTYLHQHNHFGYMWWIWPISHTFKAANLTAPGLDGRPRVNPTATIVRYLRFPLWIRLPWYSSVPTVHCGTIATSTLVTILFAINRFCLFLNRSHYCRSKRRSLKIHHLFCLKISRYLWLPSFSSSLESACHILLLIFVKMHLFKNDPFPLNSTSGACYWSVASSMRNWFSYTKVLPHTINTHGWMKEI